MKKIATIATVALLGTLFLPSCKKDYTCTCTVTIQGQSPQTTTATIEKSTKKDAKSACSTVADNFDANANGQGSMECS